MWVQENLDVSFENAQLIYLALLNKGSMSFCFILRILDGSIANGYV